MLMINSKLTLKIQCFKLIKSTDEVLNPKIDLYKKNGN